MTGHSAEQLQRLFLDALELPAEQRAAYLDTACGDNPTLRSELESLLAADAQAEQGDFLQNPGVQLNVSEDTATESLENRQIGPYRILEPLGQGGMGRVFLAEREDVGTQVALKLVPHNLISPEIRQRFLFERRVLARLSHPNIARLLDAGVTEDNMPYFVMDVAKGEPITEYCNHQHLSIEERLHLFMTVCDAVQYAHQRLIVHRDLKPQNILVGDGESGDSQVKLLDFGIAKMLAEEDDEALTKTGMRVMTMRYAAPEQILGDTITTATDVYALGLLLYQLLTGQHPYNVQGLPHEISKAIVETTPKKPSTAVKEASHSEEDTQAISVDRSTTIEQLQRRLRGDLDVICLKALEKEPERRYQTAEQLQADIRRYMTGLPVVARAPTLSYRVQKFVSKNLAAVLIVFLVSIAIFSSLGAALWQAQRAQAAAVVAQSETKTAEQVKDYLIEIFKTANPWEVPMGAELSARELLERGVQRMETLEEEPKVQAELLGVLGEAYGSLGMADEARSLLERSLEIQQTIHGEEHEEVATAMAGLAGQLFEEGAYEEAEPLYRESLAMRRRLLDGNHNDLAASLNDLAAVLNSKGAHEEAEPFLRESLAIQREIHEEDNYTIAITMANLAGVLRSRGAYEEAESLYREALAIQRAELGPDHPNIAVTLMTLGLVLRAQDRFDEVEPLFRESLDMRMRIFGDEHDNTAGARHQLGRLLMQTDRPGEAEPLFREALAVSQKVNGEQHWKTAVATVGLGSVLTALGQYEEAEIHLTDAYAFYNSGAPGPPRRKETALEALVDLYSAWGKPEKGVVYQAELGE